MNALYEEIDRLRTANAELISTAKDVMDCFFDMSPLEYAYSRGLREMGDEVGERVKLHMRFAIKRAADLGLATQKAEVGKGG